MPDNKTNKKLAKRNGSVEYIITEYFANRLSLREAIINVLYSKHIIKIQEEAKKL